MVSLLSNLRTTFPAIVNVKNVKTASRVNNKRIEALLAVPHILRKDCPQHFPVHLMDHDNLTEQVSNETFMDSHDIIFFTLLHIEATWIFLANTVVISAAVKFAVVQKASSKFPFRIFM